MPQPGQTEPSRSNRHRILGTHVSVGQLDVTHERRLDNRIFPE